MLKLGKLAYISTKNLSLPKGQVSKLLPKYIGLYEILEVFHDLSNYVLKLLPELECRGIFPKFHISCLCHDLQHSGACRTYFPQPWTRRVDPGSILAEQRTMPDEATKVGMQNTDTHIWAPSLFSSQHVYIYLTSTGNFPSLEIN